MVCQYRRLNAGLIKFQNVSPVGGRNHHGALMLAVVVMDEDIGFCRQVFEYLKLICESLD